MSKEGAAYAVPYNYARPTGDFPMGHRPSRHRSSHYYSARPIADIFVLTGKKTEGGKGEGNPHPVRSKVTGGYPQALQRGTPCVKGNRIQRGAPNELSECRILTEDRLRRGAPPNGRACLTRAAAEGVEGEGDPPLSSARPRRAAGARGGT